MMPNSPNIQDIDRHFRVVSLRPARGTQSDTVNHSSPHKCAILEICDFIEQKRINQPQRD